MLSDAGVGMLVDVRRYAGSRRNPQFNRPGLEQALHDAGIEYRHAVELGGRLEDEPGAERFGCIRQPAFRSYAARMGTEQWQSALAESLADAAPCFMCAETRWQRCHRSLIAEQLHASGVEVVHLIRLGESEPHLPGPHAETRDGYLYLCGEPVEREAPAAEFRLMQQKLFQGD